MPRKHVVEFKLDQDRILDEVTVDQYIAFEKGDTEAVVSVLSTCVWKDGAYLEADEGRATVGKISLRDLNQAIDRVRELVNEAAVPKGSEPESGSG